MLGRFILLFLCLFNIACSDTKDKKAETLYKEAIEIVPYNKEKAKINLKKACELKHDTSCLFFATIMQQDLITLKDFESDDLVFLIDQCMSQNNGGACAGLASQPFNEIINKKDRKAFDDIYPLLLDSCRLNSAVGCGLLADALMVFNFKGDAVTYYLKSCDLGGDLSCKTIGDFYGSRTQSVLPLDYKKAREFYKKACDLENNMACLNLAALHFDGLGGIADKKEAKKLSKQACELGEQKACDFYNTFFNK